MATIAIIGTGISGLGAAYLLHRHHEITVYEKQSQIGGHSRTIAVDYDGHLIPVDTGFIVFNRQNYPNLTQLFALLGVSVHKSDMSFAATIGDGSLEWGACSLNALFGQRCNLLRPRFFQLIRDVMFFNAHAEQVAELHAGLTLGELIHHMGLSEWFHRYYLLPMAGAIWSCPSSQMMAFPARTLVQFFANHHLLSVRGQHQWYTVTGGAREYVNRMAAPFIQSIRTECGACAITRTDVGVEVRDALGETRTFDHVVLACHSDTALSLLQDADERERTTLSAFRYQKNIAILHRDIQVMPRRRRCWASWVYSSDGADDQPNITVHYWMNRLQGINPACPLFVSLNPYSEIPDKLIFDRHTFEHPVFDARAIAAQTEIQALQGVRNTWYCGSYLGYGFHEDGLSSAVHLARSMGCSIPWINETSCTQSNPDNSIAA